MDLLQGVTTIVSAYGGEAQGQGLLRMDSPRGDAPTSVMLANAIVVGAGMSRDFAIDVEVLSDDAFIALKAVMGKMVTISLVRDDGALRYFNGDVFSLRFELPLRSRRRRRHAVSTLGRRTGVRRHRRTSHNRTAPAGRTFTMSGHFSGDARYDADGVPQDDIAGREYLTLSARHIGSNNYQDGRAAQSSYNTTFPCRRRTIRWRPRAGFSRVDTRIDGVQTATVVGPAGEDIHTDQSGLLTRCTCNATSGNANPLRFEDRKGQEDVWLHAEKDQRSRSSSA